MSIANRKPFTARKQLLGQILLKREVIDEHQLNHALEVQDKKGGLIGRILVNLGYVEEQDIVTALVIQCHVPYIAIDQYEIDREALSLVPREIARKYQVIPLDQVNKILSVVMADPLDMEAKSELQSLTNCRLVPFIATHGEIDKAIQRWYDPH